MRLFRFDEEVSIPVSQWGSRIRIGPLIAPDARVRVQILHLPPNGLIGRHRAAGRQLFAVVAGEGWVSGGDGRRNEVIAGQAVLWERGEEHEAGSERGLTATSIEGDFELLAAAVTVDIVVSDYDPAWPEWFQRLHDHVWPAVRDVAVRIEHVGSTAVPGIAAKPIIDMDIVLASEDDVQPVIDRLATIGYRWRGDLGVEGRQAFQATRDEGLPPHNLYAVVDNNKAYLDHVLLRDLLRADASARSSYAALKRQNVQIANNNMDIYVAAKARLVAELLSRARAERGLPPATYWEPENPPPLRPLFQQLLEGSHPRRPFQEHGSLAASRSGGARCWTRDITFRSSSAFPETTFPVPSVWRTSCSTGGRR